MRSGEVCREESLEEMAARTVRSLGSLPAELRPPEQTGAAYPVEFSKSLTAAR
jgi:hypothetical protein